MTDTRTNWELEDVIITDLLGQRASRAPDYHAESRALATLARELADRPENVLQKITDQIVGMGIAPSAGVSLWEGDRFRWHAISGAWEKYRGAGMDFDASPCGVVVSRNQALLFEHPERVFPGNDIAPLIKEALLVPFRLNGSPVGTLWVLAHDEARKFDREDERFLTSISRIAAAAYRMTQAIEGVEAGAREAEIRYQSLFNSIDEGFCTIEVLFDETGHSVDYRFLETNPAFERQTGLEGAVGRTMRELSPDHEQHWFDIYGQIVRTGEPQRFERPAEALGHWYDVYAFPVGEPEERRVAILFNDISERKLTEARQQNLLAELQHRVRNTLAIIRSIVRRTALSSTSVDDFEQHLDGRLGSFARTQAYVTRHPDRGVDLELLVRDEMLAHATEGSQQVKIAGPQVRLRPKQAQTLGLAIHELTSNAIRHGALASDGNHVDVRWALTGTAKAQRLCFEWREWLGNGELKEPESTGFGMELLDRVLRYELDAEPQLEFRPDGFSFEVEFPLARD